MPEISMEILCLVVLILLAFLSGLNKAAEKNSPVYSVFVRLLVCGIINILCETLASFAINNRTYFRNTIIIIFLEIFLISLIVVMFFAYLYIHRLINSDVPSLKKIGKWTHAIVLIMAVIIGLIPPFSVENNDGVITFGSGIKMVYFFLALFEILLAIIIFAYRKYINAKRRKILWTAYLIQVICYVLQALFPHFIMSGIAVTIMTVSFYMTLEDEDVRLIDQLAIEKDNADRANKAKSDFIANVSHEIRTPINAVLGMDEMILRETKEEATRQYASDIKSAAQTLHGIINEILDMSKMESGKMEIVPNNYNMRALISDTINIIQLKLDDKKLGFNLDIDSSIPSGYYGDETRIKQILSNILSNAVKYTNEGSVSMTIKGQRVSVKEESIFVEIKDTGIGMKPEDLQEMFEAYKRCDINKNREVEGTGLGMTITMQLLEMMGSKLEVSSVYGEGSVFSFSLKQPVWDETPLGDFRKVKPEVKKEYEYEKTFEAPSTKVLVVDDNAINRKVFLGLLKDTKLDIDEAESGPACIEMVKQNKYSLIFMDHMMPDMDGIETFRIMKEMDDNLSADAVVIMLTANAVMGAKEMYLEEGFDDFMSKPIIPAKLEEMIRKYLNL